MKKVKNYNINIFKNIVYFVSEMIKNKTIKVNIVSASVIRFVIVDALAVQEFADKNKLDFEDLIYTIEYEIPAYMTSVLGGVSLAFEEMVGGEKDDEKIKIERQQKIKVVEDILIDSEIKNIHLLKTTSKLKTIQAIDWEINSKIYDDSNGKIPDLKYATINLKLMIQDPSSFLVRYLDAGTSNVIFNCDYNDIENLIETLKTIHRQLTNESSDDDA